MSPSSRFVAVVAVAAGVLAFLRRPVKQPDAIGTWQPADQQKTPRR